MFRSFHFSFLVFGHFWRQSYKSTKILRNLCLHFARQDGQDGKNYVICLYFCNFVAKSDPKLKNKKWDERNIKLHLYEIQSPNT